MSGELANFVSPLLNSLENFISNVNSLGLQHSYFNSRMRSLAISLVEAQGFTEHSSEVSLATAGMVAEVTSFFGAQGFTGETAQAYLGATAEYIANSEAIAQHMGHACSVIAEFCNSVWLETDVADIKINREFFVSSMAKTRMNSIMDHLNLGDVLKLGQNAIQNAMNETQNDFLHQNENLSWGDGKDGLTKWNAFTSEFDALEAQLSAALYSWADTVHAATYNLLTQIDLDFPSMRSLAIMDWRGYDTGKPIGITQIGSNRILVTLAGLEPGKWDQSNNALNAIDAGEGHHNAYEQDVRNAIEAFIRDHHLPAGTQVVIAGHSLGGMVAQEIGFDPRNNYTVTDVITFGSPELGPPLNREHWQEYFTLYDPVTRPFSKPDEIELPAQDVKDVLRKDKPQGLFDMDFHGVYPHSKWLGQQPVPFNIDQIGPTQYFSTTSQNWWNKLSTGGKDLLGADMSLNRLALSFPVVLPNKVIQIAPLPSWFKDGANTVTNVLTKPITFATDAGDAVIQKTEDIAGGVWGVATSHWPFH